MTLATLPSQQPVKIAPARAISDRAAAGAIRGQPMRQEPAAPTDQELIAGVNAGDDRAFAALYLRYRDWVATLAYRVTGDRDLALDVTQETFLYLLRKFPGFTLTSQFKTFLYPAVRHLAIAAAQKAKRNLSAEEPALDNLPSLSDDAPQSDSTRHLAAVMQNLPPGQQQVLMLRFVEGLPLAEIAAALGLPLGTVKSRLSLALAALRADPRTKEFFETK